MNEFHNHTFEGVHLGSDRNAESVRLVDCQLLYCHCGASERESGKVVFRNIELIRCKSTNGSTGPIVLEDSLIEDFATNELHILWGPMFRHVTIRGKIGQIKINPYIQMPMPEHEAANAQHWAYMAEYYKSVDWALDISKAKFSDFNVSGVPARKIVRDPESQVLVTREKASDPEWRKRVSKENDYWPFVLQMSLSEPDDVFLLVAPLGLRKAKRDPLLAGLRELRDLGVAEPE